MEKEKPKYLYKYRPINRHTLNMILSYEAHFSLPIDFNDPFDCNLVPEFVYTTEEQKKFFSNLESDGRISQKEYMDLIKNPTKIIEQEWEKTIENIRNNLKIFCLSEVNNDVMMYSHYADSHKGICVEFLVSDEPFFDSLNYIHYVEKFPVFHPFGPDMNLIRKELAELEVLTKSYYWCYEKEWRIIKSDPDTFNYRFSPQSLSSIIFGYQTPVADRLLIERIISKSLSPIQLKEATKKNKSFELEVRPYLSQIKRGSA